MITRLAAQYDADNNYFVNVTTGGFGMTIPEEFGSLKYFTGLLNSMLLDWTLKRVSTTFHGGYFAANKQYLVQLPIRRIDFTNSTDKSSHDKMVGYVEQMISAKKELANTLTDKDTTYWQRRCDTLDRQIDALVYELYDLTEDEIALVEGAAGPA